jgi:ADP-ribose pyrophosphatase YjhB (NUDIX family)
MVTPVALLDGWRSCPRCAGPLTRRGDGSVRCAACGFQAWGHSVPGAQALVERDGCVLLGRRAHDPGAGLWDVPGGFLEEAEQPLDGLRRELREETGLEVEPTEFFGIWLQPYEGRTVLCLTWLARATGGEERAGDDLTELRWFRSDELPTAGDLAFESYVDILAVWSARQTARNESRGAAE